MSEEATGDAAGGGRTPGNGDDGGEGSGGGNGQDADDGRRRAARGGRFAAAAHAAQEVPRGGAAAAGAVHAVRQARAAYAASRGALTLADGGRVDGARPGEAGPAPLPGPVPAEELRHLRRVFARPPEYAQLLDALRRRRVLALCGEPGSGRGLAALALLDEVAHGAVARLDPRTDLATLAEASVKEGHGYCLELTGEEPTAARGPQLDRLGALLAERDAHLVLVVDAGDAADELLRGRDGRLFLPPPGEEVLARHLVALLADADEETRARARRTAERRDVADALGLDELRPGEAVALAGLLARHATGALSDAGLLAECERFAPRQAAAWFAGAGSGAARAAAPAGLRPAAFRIGLAVYDGAPHSVAAEAAETLTWEMATTLDPERPPGRPLFSDDLRAVLTAARAELADGDVWLGDDRLPVRTVRFAGRGLPWAVLSRVWEWHHNARGPVCRWLRAQCDDPRPLAWVPAAMAAGALCALDFPYAQAELIAPLAASDSGTQRLAAATALAHTVARDARLRPVVRSLVAEWARGDDELLLSTAALTHGYGTVAGSVARSLDALGPMAEWVAGGELLRDAAFGVARLAAGHEPETVLRRIGAWLDDRRGSRDDLALLAVVRLAGSRTWELWGLEEPAESAEPAARQGWPLLPALLAAHPAQAPLLADLVGRGLAATRSRDAVLSGLTTWIRAADESGELLDRLCAFLPELAATAPANARHLRSRVARLTDDPDGPLGAATATRVTAALAG
ncbi:hypothetical protein [Streptomyces sp. 6N223]|uniref:hypothetical protein n=1 Tax=Streptomyces sp. 6N223 TaxID=3457412 RepID=UPI003FD3E767